MKDGEESSSSIPPHEDPETLYHWKDDAEGQRRIRRAFKHAGLGKPKHRIRNMVRATFNKVLDAIDKSGWA
ncbi:MAG TPA: hypothetical protein VEW42_04010 [Candidatus Eisenbacteria bacterium]|nr:hypothetical protein [Candidatus Eisenbacteria bacterium]